jgi:hypothetical protein
MAWDIQKGGERGRALIYIPKSNKIIGQPIYSHPINQLNPETGKSLSYNMASDSMQPLDNTKLDNRTDSVYPINELSKCSQCSRRDGCMLTEGQKSYVMEGIDELEKPRKKDGKGFRR